MSFHYNPLYLRAENFAIPDLVSSNVITIQILSCNALLLSRNYDLVNPLYNELRDLYQTGADEWETYDISDMVTYSSQPGVRNAEFDSDDGLCQPVSMEIL